MKLTSDEYLMKCNLPALLSMKELSLHSAIVRDSLPLSKIKEVYSEAIPILLIKGWLLSFQDLSNIKDDSKLNANQINIFSSIIYDKLKGLNVYEIAVFFKMVISGQYGEFFGNIDIMKISTWLNSFLEYRGRVIMDNEDIYIKLRDRV
jgi:hypothetical protein